MDTTLIGMEKVGLCFWMFLKGSWSMRSVELKVYIVKIYIFLLYFFNFSRAHMNWATVLLNFVTWCYLFPLTELHFLFLKMY